MTSEIIEIQRELQIIRKILNQINARDRDDESDLYEEQAELGFFGTSYSTTLPHEELSHRGIETNVNVFETVDEENLMRLSDENMKNAIEKAKSQDFNKLNREPREELKVPVSFELEEDLFLELAIAAHKKDMTFNDFIVYLIDEHMTEILNNK